MPYSIQRHKSKYCLIREDGSVKQCHKTKEDAEAAQRIILAREHGYTKAVRRRIDAK